MLKNIFEVCPNLWIGGFPARENVLPFDKLVLCAAEHQPSSSAFPGVAVFHMPIAKDADSQDQMRIAVQAGRAVAGWLKREKKVLVSDAMGLNRSALIATVALMTRGVSRHDATHFVRTARQGALQNPRHVALLQRLEDARDFYVVSSI